MKKSRILMAMLLIFVLAITGCTQTPVEEPAPVEEPVSEEPGEEPGLTYEGDLIFSGEASFSIAYNDIYAMETVERTVKHISSSGEESTNDVSGVLLSDILSANGLDQKTLGAIRFIAGDGYAIDVPQEIIQEKEIVLAWTFDGTQLEDKKMPLRVAIDDVRSMYYVSNLSEVSISKAGAMTEEKMDKTIVLMETAIVGLESMPFTYYDSEDMAINAKDLIEAFVSSTPESVAFMANDGYEKTESFDVVSSGFIKYTGEDAPLFTGKDLPKGMNVKYIMTMGIDNVNFVSVGSAKGSMNLETINDNEGVNLKELVEMAGLKADTYILTAADGYQKTVTAEEMAIGIAYLNDDNTARAIFNVEVPKKSTVKELLTITAGEPSMDESAEESTDINWVVTVDGLSDGSFDFDKERAERKLKLIDVHTERMKNDEKKPEDWQGYKVLDILSFLKVEDFNSILVVAGDGYEVELMKDQVDDETILAVVKDGEAMTDTDNMVQLVQNTEFATTWVKGVVKIIVK